MITYEIVIPPSNGTVVIVGDEARYTSNQGYVGSDSFTYRQLDDGVEVVQRKVCITVEQGNFPKEWRPSGSSCEVINGMITGKLVYSTLTEYDTFTGLPTGLTKPNSVGDPDYVPPIFDSVSCPASVGWRGVESSAYCEVGSDTGNTGKKVYTELEQYYLINGVLTGLTKANTVGEADYVAPVEDLSKCPVNTVQYMSIQSSIFFSELCDSGYANPVPFSKTYFSNISQADADNKRDSDTDFNTEGQLYANLNGTCAAPGVILLGYDTYFRSLPCATSGQQNRLIFATYQDILDLETVTTVSSATGIFFYKDLNGTIPVDAGWYMGLSNDKSFYVGSNGEVQRYEICTVPLPVLHLAVESIEIGSEQVVAMLTSPYNQPVRVQGRVDVQPLQATPDGVSFDITIPAGEIQATDPNSLFIRQPGVTYYWTSWGVTPDGFTVQKQDPI